MPSREARAPDGAQSRPGFGTRHPDLLALLARHEADAVEDIVWPSGMRLRLSAYVYPKSPSEKLAKSPSETLPKSPSEELPDEQHVWPGGRREPGESYAATVCREVHEETGWIIDPDQLRPLGFLHYWMYDEQPADHPYPHPDFLQIVYTAPARARDGNGSEWHDLDGWELGSRLVTPEELASVPLAASPRPFLAVLDD